MGGPRRVVADVGGSNTRMAVFDEAEARFSHVASFSNAAYDSLEAVIEAWRDTLQESWPDRACFAVAAPPGGDQVDMSNINWSFSCRALAKRFGFARLLRLNDFEANAHALPGLTADDLEPVHRGSATGFRDLCTVGPGTGLGGATLRWLDDRPVAAAAEPGHMGLSPGSDLELAIFRHLLPEHSNIYTELLVSGPGLARLYRAIAELHGAEADTREPAEISRRAIEGSDGHCVTALDTFCALLGSTCGDFALANGTYGGLFIAGGIAPRIRQFLLQSEFLQRLQNKGAMTAQLQAMPVHIIVAGHPGLTGAAHAPI